MFPTLLLQVRDRLTDIFISTWPGIRLKARYSSPVSSSGSWARKDHGGRVRVVHGAPANRLQAGFTQLRKGRGEERESFWSSLSTEAQSMHARAASQSNLLNSFRKKTVTVIATTVFLHELSHVEGISAAGLVHPRTCIPSHSSTTHVAPSGSGCQAPLGGRSHARLLGLTHISPSYALLWAAAAAKAIGELPSWPAIPP